MALRFEPIKPRIGARISASEAELLTDQAADDCLALLETHGILVFPQLNLSDDEQIQLTGLLSDRLNKGAAAAAKGHDRQSVYQVTLNPETNAHPEYVLGTFFWHMDGLTQAIAPTKATLLSARSVAANGGQTDFASTFAAYQALPEAEKAEIADLKVIHTIRAALRAVVDDPTQDELDFWAQMSTEMAHPLVWTQASGRKALVIGYTADRVVDQEPAHGRALLARLLEWTAQPEFSYRHQWSEGDFVIWDNCGMVHRVIPYDKASGRMMHRTTVAGVEAIR